MTVSVSQAWQRSRLPPVLPPALPLAAPARVLAFGAFLKNRACLLQGREVLWSPEHGDLGTPEACAALAMSTEALLHEAGGHVDAVAHDLHPDFHSTRLALEMADRLGVPAVAVQHHHAHIAVVQAELGWGHGPEHGPGLGPGRALDGARPLLGLALDGVGLGTDGLAWGGEVLRLAGASCERLAHLPLLPLPGGDAAAREPWRLVAALLHESGRAAEIVPRLAPLVGERLARGVATLLARNLNCPRTSSAGRWFDAAAGALGLSQRQAHEAEAAMALEAAARAWLETAEAVGAVDVAQAGRARPEPEAPTLDLRPLVASLLDETDAGHGAARFHLALAGGLVAEVKKAARAAADVGGVTNRGSADVALGGGCFFNRVLSREIEAGLLAAGHRVWRPATVGVGDAGLALGQAWVAALQIEGDRAAPSRLNIEPALAEET